MTPLLPRLAEVPADAARADLAGSRCLPEKFQAGIRVGPTWHSPTRWSVPRIPYPIGDHGQVAEGVRAAVQTALGPLAARAEAAMQRCLPAEASRRKLYVEHDLSRILRGDVRARFEACRIGREIVVYGASGIRGLVATTTP